MSHDFFLISLLIEGPSPCSAILSFLWVWLESAPSDFYAPPTHADLVALEAFAGRWAGHHGELQPILTAVRQSFARKTMSSDKDTWLGDFEGVGSCKLVHFYYSAIRMGLMLRIWLCCVYGHSLPNV